MWFTPYFKVLGLSVDFNSLLRQATWDAYVLALINQKIDLFLRIYTVQLLVLIFRCNDRVCGSIFFIYRFR